MREVQKPKRLLLVVNLILLFLSLSLLALFSNAPGHGSRLTGVFLGSLMTTLSITQCVLYLKSYIDYRLNEIELNKSVKSV
jgi:type III secretory pathway component EscU